MALEKRLYQIAYDCTEMMDTMVCDQNCAVCRFNIFNYVEQRRDGDLLKANAEADYYRLKNLRSEVKADREAGFWGPMLSIALVIGLIIWAVRACVG